MAALKRKIKYLPSKFTKQDFGYEKNYLQFNPAVGMMLAWRIPGTGEPGGLPSMGSRRVGHD